MRPLMASYLNSLRALRANAGRRFRMFSMARLMLLCRDSRARSLCSQRLDR